MLKKHVFGLCVCNFAVFAGLGALVGIMPIYLTRLGADSSVTGFFLAFAYLSLAISSVIGGRWSDRLQRRRRLLMICGALAAPLTLIMGQVTNVLPLMLLMGGMWLATGTVMTFVGVLAALSSDDAHRTRVFGMLSLSVNLGLLFGSLISGRLVDQWGYPALFVALALIYLLIPLGGVWVRDPAGVTVPTKAATATGYSIFTNHTLRMLFIASVLAQAANSVIFLSRPLIMDALRFDATTVTAAAGVGGLLTLFLPVAVGWLADRFGRKPIVIACFVAPLLGLLILIIAADYWLFVLTAALGSILGISWVVISAFLAEIVPAESLGTALAQISVTPWIGIMMGLSAGGVAIRTFEMTPTLLLSAVIGGVALVLCSLVSIPQRTSVENRVSPQRLDTAVNDPCAVEH